MFRAGYRGPHVFGLLDLILRDLPRWQLEQLAATIRAAMMLQDHRDRERADLRARVSAFRRDQAGRADALARRVTRLAARGLTNAEIGRRVGLSGRQVARHLAHARKAGFRGGQAGDRDARPSPAAPQPLASSAP